VDDTVTKCSVCYPVYGIGIDTTEIDLQDGEVIDDRRSNRHDNQECRGGQQQYCAKVVEESADTHDEGLKCTEASYSCAYGEIGALLGVALYVFKRKIQSTGLVSSEIEVGRDERNREVLDENK
jgi:hypothetical protein